MVFHLFSMKKRLYRLRMGVKNCFQTVWSIGIICLWSYQFLLSMHIFRTLVHCETVMSNLFVYTTTRSHGREEDTAVTSINIAQPINDRADWKQVLSQAFLKQRHKVASLHTHHTSSAASVSCCLECHESVDIAESCFLSFPSCCSPQNCSTE